ncbi:MAG: 50S ribosomal protein L10 [Gracilibacteraceae bacterium]|jgi:large subunit ribosomal protein L10|nr:50S ribosomal protein L10 [Gracilibacteraceae bacterium]
MPDYTEKQKIVEEIKEKFRGARGVVLADYRGLTVAEVTDLRNQLRAAGIEYRVLKNTMIRRAADEIELQGLEPYLKGPTAAAFAEDPVAPAKILVEYSRKYKAFEIKAGVLENRVIDADGVSRLAELPSREVLLAQTLAGISAPLQGMVNVLQAPLRQLAYALEDLRKTKESAA